MPDTKNEELLLLPFESQHRGGECAIELAGFEMLVGARGSSAGRWRFERTKKGVAGTMDDPVVPDSPQCFVPNSAEEIAADGTVDVPRSAIDPDMQKDILNDVLGDVGVTDEGGGEFAQRGGVLAGQGVEGGFVTTLDSGDARIDG